MGDTKWKIKYCMLMCFQMLQDEVSNQMSQYCLRSDSAIPGLLFSTPYKNALRFQSTYVDKCHVLDDVYS